LGDVGDVVLTSPSIRAVKEACPQALVSIVVTKPYGALLGTDPHLAEVVEVSKKRGPFFSRLREYLAFVRRLRRAKYDLVIDLRTGDRGAILSLLSGAAVRIGQPGMKKQFWHQFAFTNTVRDMEIALPPAHPGADQSLRILRKIGINTDDTIPKLFISPKDQTAAEDILESHGLLPPENWVTINPFSRWKYKEWSNAKWVEVINQVWKAHRIRAVLIGSQDERAGCDEIVARCDGRAVNLAGTTSLSELAAVISMSSLHVGVDSAAPHIAAAVGTPTVTIHGPTDWRAWRIADARHKIVSPEMGCVPCNMVGCNGSGRSICMEDLEVAHVAAAALDILKDIALQSGHTIAPR
jgi:heptosyltransferase-3